MKYFSEDEIYINAECDHCGKVLRIKKEFCIKDPEGYRLNQPLKCFCGNISDKIEITKPEQKPIKNETPKKKSFWQSLLDSSNEYEERKKAKANEPLRCPKCGSTQITAYKKGFSVGKAVVGDLVAGPLGGLLAGGIGSKKIMVVCLKCGHTWKAGKK